ncbi:MAG: peptidase [Coxiella sp. (in: Bacteria)]|nr:MAG: peptidase [Coxiella sp. (in: g-proteobacteria)]
MSRCFWAGLSLIITLMIILSIVYTYLEFQLPDVSVLKDVHLQVPLRIYTREGQLIAQYGSMRRTPVSLDQIPPNLIKAVLATEDARYYEHPGVDFVGIVRAAIAVITSGKKVQGASTITMQVARNFFLSRKKTYGRKIREILLALKIDKELSKDKVLELYLNKVYFGKQAYGVAAAATVYYGKALNQLNLAQMAMIAGLPQAPSRNNPVSNPPQAMKRRDHVLWRMKKVGFITPAQYNDAVQQPITATFHGRTVQVNAPYFAEVVRQAVINDYGNDAYNTGLSVYTTLSANLQQAAIHSLQEGLIDYSKRHGYRGPQTKLGDPTTANLQIWQKTLLKMGNPAHLIPAAVLVDNDQSLIALVADGTNVTIPWSGLSWARPQLKNGVVGRTPKTAEDIAQPGDVIWITQTTRGRWLLVQLPKVQGAIISMNPQNGAILALSGGFNYRTSNFNRAIQAQRQPGSGFKPFIYSAALNKGFTLASIINDAPIVLEDSGENSLWRPHNDTNKFYGPTRLKVGLAKSRNLVSIRLLQSIGIDYTLNYVKRFGFNPDLLPHTLSLALGSGTVTPMQMAAGYLLNIVSHK